MSFLNADVANAVNPYLTDVGVGLVFGLGYYVIKYLYGENTEKKGKETKLGTENTIQWEGAKTIEEFNHLIKTNEEDSKMNPFEVLNVINKKQLSPDINTYNNLLNSCYHVGNFECADKLKEEIIDFTTPVQPDLSTFNILLKGVSCKMDHFGNELTVDQKINLVETTDKIFDDLKKLSLNNSSIKPNDITINTILDILIKAGEIKRAWELFDSMKEEEERKLIFCQATHF